MKQELVDLQPKLEQAKVDNANMMKVTFLLLKMCQCCSAHSGLNVAGVA